MDCLNILFELPNISLQELQVELPADCSQISWPDLSKLHTLSLEITSSTCSWKFGCVLYNSISLKTLEIIPCSYDLCLTAEDWEDIAQYIATCSSLKKLSFSSDDGYFTDNEGIYIIKKALANNHLIQLEYLDFSTFLEVIIDDVDDFAEYLSNTTSLLELSLPYFTKFSCSSLLKMTRALTDKPHLLNTLSDRVKEYEEVFTLEGDQDLSAFVQLIREFPEMMQDCDINIEKVSNEGLKQLATTLKTDTCIKYLSLSHQEITSDGAKVLAEALSSNNHVCFLDLGHNKIDDEGAHALVKMLYSNKCLENLHLSNNLIEDGGAIALAQAFHANTSLDHIVLAGNPISWMKSCIIHGLSLSRCI